MRHALFYETASRVLTRDTQGSMRVKHRCSREKINDLVKNRKKIHSWKKQKSICNWHENWFRENEGFFFPPDTTIPSSWLFYLPGNHWLLCAEKEIQWPNAVRSRQNWQTPSRHDASGASTPHLDAPQTHAALSTPQDQEFEIWEGIQTQGFLKLASGNLRAQPGLKGTEMGRVGLLVWLPMGPRAIYWVPTASVCSTAEWNHNGTHLATWLYQSDGISMYSAWTQCLTDVRAWES